MGSHRPVQPEPVIGPSDHHLCSGPRRTSYGKPNNNCAPDKLVEVTREFGTKSRIPMLWIYAENDTYFGPDLANRMHKAFTEAGGKAEFRIFPPFGSDGHFLSMRLKPFQYGRLS